MVVKLMAKTKAQKRRLAFFQLCLTYFFTFGLLVTSIVMNFIEFDVWWSYLCFGLSIVFCLILFIQNRFYQEDVSPITQKESDNDD